MPMAQLNVVENVCAHRGMRFCRERHGNRKEFVCPYHQWNYTLKGDLQGVPFRRGVKQDGQVHGGMPADFKTADHGLTKLKVATRGGVVFASFDPDVEPFEDYLGPDHPGLLRPAVQRPKAQDPGLQPPAHPGQLEADAGEHQGPVPPGPAAHLVRHLRPLARRQQVACCAWMRSTATPR
jgi:salicylate 5-hydroxylase large subunit